MNEELLLEDVRWQPLVIRIGLIVHGVFTVIVILPALSLVKLQQLTAGNLFIVCAAFEVCFVLAASVTMAISRQVRCNCPRRLEVKNGYVRIDTPLGSQVWRGNECMWTKGMSSEDKLAYFGHIKRCVLILLPHGKVVACGLKGSKEAWEAELKHSGLKYVERARIWVRMCVVAGGGLAGVAGGSAVGLSLMALECIDNVIGVTSAFAVTGCLIGWHLWENVRPDRAFVELELSRLGTVVIVWLVGFEFTRGVSGGGVVVGVLIGVLLSVLVPMSLKVISALA